MQIRIKGYTFSLLTPFSEGHRLTNGEAQALNDLRAENIQNNFRSFVNEQVSRLKAGELLQQWVLDGLQIQLTSYDQGYKFNEKSTRNRTGDIEREAVLIAQERVAQQLQSNPEGLNLGSDKTASLVAEYTKLPAVIDEARSRVAARRSVLAGGMDSL